MSASKTNMICVGGPMHGQRKAVEEGRRYWECIERPRIVAGDYLIEDVPESIDYKRHVYEREVMGAGERSITFWRHSEMPVGQVAFYLLNDLSDNAPYTRITTLEWALKKIRDVVTYEGDFKSLRSEAEQNRAIWKLVNSALRPSTTQPVDE